MRCSHLRHESGISEKKIRHDQSGVIFHIFRTNVIFYVKNVQISLMQLRNQNKIDLTQLVTLVMVGFPTF